MEDKRVELKELKGDLVRCVIPYKDIDGNDKQIEVYNIQGERRKQVLDNMSEIADKVAELGEIALEDYYSELIMEFTDITLDKTSIVEILESPKLEWIILRSVLDDMIYELQYEQMCNVIQQSRLIGLSSMVAQMEKEQEVFAKKVEESNKIIGDIEEGE